MSIQLPEVFTLAQVCRYAGITERQARYWDATGLVSPSVRDPEARGEPTLYSRDDALELRAIANALRSGRRLQDVRAQGYGAELLAARDCETWRREGGPERPRSKSAKARQARRSVEERARTLAYERLRHLERARFVMLMREAVEELRGEPHGGLA